MLVLLSSLNRVAVALNEWSDLPSKRFTSMVKSHTNNDLVTPLLSIYRRKKQDYLMQQLKVESNSSILSPDGSFR